MKRRIALILSAVILASAFSLCTVSASNGSCGATAVWNFDSELGILYISGTGAMTDYDSVSGVPWYHYADAITKVQISEQITHVGENAFRRLQKLSSVKLPSTLKSIGAKAFAYCYELSELALPSLLMQIGESAFYYCKALTQVSLPSGIEAIENDTFFGCQALTSVVMGDNVKTIGERAFYFCTKLSRLRLSSSIESIGSKAFDYCESLSSFTCVMSDDDWADVSIGDGNKYLNTSTRIKTDYVAGDTNADGSVDSNDAVHLLYSIFFGQENYPLNQNCDFNKDSVTDSNDAVYLLYHVFFGSQGYPL